MNIPYQSIDEIENFISRFERGDLSKTEWTHKAHFIVGLWYLLTNPSAQALQKLRCNIKSNNLAIGIANTDESGYHETITCFYVWAIERYIGENKIENLEIKYFNKILQDPIVDKNYPLKFYSKEVLFSLAARKNWLAPNLQPITHNFA